MVRTPSMSDLNEVVYGQVYCFTLESKMLDLNVLLIYGCSLRVRGVFVYIASLLCCDPFPIPFL